MRKNSIKNKHNNTIQKLKSNTRNKMNSDKKKFAISKKKYFSISSKEDIVKNTFRNCLVNKELEYYAKTHRALARQKIISPNTKFYSHNISHNSKKKFLTEKIDTKKNKSKRKISMFNKNELKKTIIIDNDGNTNLNIKNIFGNENKCPKI